MIGNGGSAASGRLDAAAALFAEHGVAAVDRPHRRRGVRGAAAGHHGTGDALGLQRLHQPGDEIGPMAIELDQPLPSVPEPATAAETVPRPATPAGIVALVGRRVEDVERDLILETLGHCLGNRTHAATILGISIRTLRNKLNEYADEGAAIPAPQSGVSASGYAA